MSALLAIVGDTWRQSRQQIVFYLLIAAFLLSVVGFIGFPKVFKGADGDEFLGYVLQTKPESGMESGWDAAYKNAVARDKNHTGRMKGVREAAIDSASKARLKKVTFEELKARNASQSQQDEAKKELETALKDLEEKEKAYSTLKFDLEDEVNNEVQKRSEGVSKLKKGVEVWLALAVGWLFRISMWLFIAACAGYFPGMLAAGAVDVLVSKPIERYQLFLGKFVGGLVLYSVALIATYLVLFIGVGIRTGVWHAQLFSALPLTIFSVALLYAVVLWIGMLTRSTPLALIIGYFFYFVIDMGVGLLQTVRPFAIAEEIEWLKTISDVSSWLFPGFGRLREAAESAVVNVPIFEWQPILIGAVWMAVCLGTAQWRFKKLDF